MKRIITIVGVVIGLLVIAAVAVVGTAFLGRQAIKDVVEINGIRIVKDGIVSVAVLPDRNGEVALIDAGNDKSGTAILAELSRRQLGPEAVTAILVTHGHPDHLGAVALFPKAQVMSLGPEVALVEGRAGARGPLPRFFPVKSTGITVARTLQDGETVTLGRTVVRVFAVPGHTAGSAAYLVNGVLFLGDAADAASDGTIKAATWLFSDDQTQDRASLVALHQRLAQEGTDVKALAFAHSGVLADGLAPLAAFVQQNP